MKLTFLTALCCAFFLDISAQTEILKSLGGRAKSKVEQQDFNSTRSNKEKLNGDRKQSAPAPASSAPAPESEAPAEGSSSGERTNGDFVITSSSGNTNYQDSYTFSQKLTYEIEDPENKEKQAITYYYSDNAILTLFGDKEMASITDFTNESMITFDEKEKSAMAMSMSWAEKMTPKQAENSEEAKITKTGKKKQIIGYTCEEYLVEDSKTKSVCWITSEITVNYANAMAAMAKGNPDASKFSQQGLMMEATTYNKKGELEMHMIVTEYKLETLVKLLSEYTVTAL